MVKKIIAFKTSDGSIFESELDAYKYENMCLEKISSETNGINVVLSNDFIKPITEINGIQIEKNIKSFDVKSILDSNGNSIPNNPIIYLWYNIIEKTPYVGSSKNPTNRVLNFIDFETFKYAGSKINNARERFKAIGSLVWKLFILEENVSDDLLSEREQYYINKFNSIEDGYNISNPVNVKCSDKTYKKELATQAYYSMIKRIKNWGMNFDETISLENFIESYVPNNSGINPYDALYFSFRLPCFMKNKNVVSFDDLIKLPRRVNDIIDCGKTGFRNDDDIYPTSMIRYRACDNVYLALNDVTKTFNTPYEAVSYRIESLKNDIINNIDGEELNFIKSLCINDFIKLCYHDFDKVINFLENSRKDFEDVTNEKEIIDNNSDITKQKSHQIIKINDKVLEYKRMFTSNDLLPVNRYKHFKNAQASVFMCYNTVEKLAFIGKTEDSVHSLAKFFYVGPFGGKKLDLARKKYFDDKDVWKLFTLEENLQKNELVETQKYYVNLYNTINNGYNTTMPKDIPYEKTGKAKITKSTGNEHKKLIKNHYTIFIGNVEKFGYKLSNDFTFDIYNDMFTYDFYKRDVDKYISFRIPCFIYDYNIVTQKNICYLPYGISKHIDCLKRWEFNKTESGKLIPNFIRYNKHTDEYTAVGLCGRYYSSLKCALEAYLQLLLNKFKNILNSGYLKFDIDTEIIEFLENMDCEMLLKLCFENPDKLIEIIKKPS